MEELREEMRRRGLTGWDDKRRREMIVTLEDMDKKRKTIQESANRLYPQGQYSANATAKKIA
jgi:hypothetical protein